MNLSGCIFDLDGTLVDSRLDFDAIRTDLGLPAGRPILEAIAELTDANHASRLHARLDEHERRGAEAATLNEGVAAVLASLRRSRVRCAVVTRNSAPITKLTLQRFGLAFDVIVTRDDPLPHKPAPDAVVHVCRHWQFRPEQVAMVGDYLFDIQAGRAAGTQTVLYAPGPRAPHYADQAHGTIRHFDELLPLLASLTQ